MEKLAQAISDMAAGQDLRHAKPGSKMSELLAAPPPAATESVIALGTDAATEVRTSRCVRDVTWALRRHGVRPYYITQPTFFGAASPPLSRAITYPE